MILAAVALLPVAVFAGPPSNQRQINELAARFIDTQEALRGLTCLPRPGEDKLRYQTRIRGYLSALDGAVRDSADLRTAVRSDAVWQGIAVDAGRLQKEVSWCHVIWDRQTARFGRRSLGHTMAKALTSVQSILNGLRDARP